MNEILERPRTMAIPYDRLRYMVPSQHPEPGKPPDKYLVEIDAYNGNGACSCKHFAVRCEPLLRRDVHPREAVETKQIKLKENRQVQDALRCEHILTARSQFVDDVLDAIRNAQEKHTPKAYRVA